MPEKTVMVCDLYPECQKALTDDKGATLSLEIVDSAGEDGTEATGAYCSPAHAARAARVALKGK